MTSKTRRVDPNDGRVRCAWAAGDALLAAYHDLEWGRPIRTDAGHLERMALEIFQCGLSWRIVLVKRPALRKAFDGFAVRRVAAFTDRDVARLCRDPSIIRNERKIKAVVENARRFLAIAAEHGSFVRWLRGLRMETRSELAEVHRVFRQTFRFMGPETTKCYLMGAGLIEPPHEPGCWRRA